MRLKSSKWQETVLCWVLTLGIPYALLWEGLVVLPSYHSYLSPVIFIHAFLGLYLVIIILINFWKVINIDISVKQDLSSERRGRDMPFCQYCEVYKPPRSFHCEKCNSCIDKRDHHCLFTGCCVGRLNHRYFVSGILAVFVGAVYGIVYEWQMVVRAAGGYSAWLPLQLLAPHLIWPLGLLDAWGFTVCVHNMLGLAVLVNSGVILYMQLAGLRRGQTQWERKHGVVAYDCGLWQNVRNVLGNRWLAALLWPLANSPLPEQTEGGSTLHDKAL